jgi:hypothetical protein
MRDWTIQFWLQLSEVLRNFGLIAAGAIGLWIAWLRVRAANRQAEAAVEQSAIANEQAKLARREHVAELFNQAVGQLSDKKLEIRLGAIYTLREVTADFPDLTNATIELLTAYVRTKPKRYGKGNMPADVAEIMRIIVERKGAQK